MQKKNHFNAGGVSLIVFVVLFGALLILLNYLYRDVKKVETAMNNLHEQLQNANSKLQKIDAGNAVSKSAGEKFAESTKTWQEYVDQSFGFKFKSPLGWGNVEFKEQGVETAVAESPGKFLIGKFNFKPQSDLSVEIKTNDNLLGQSFSNESVRIELAAANVGDCSAKMFTALKTLALGEIRNCTIKENSVFQKYISFRFVEIAKDKQEIDKSVALFLMKDFYTVIFLPAQITDDETNFIRSFVFDANKM